MDTEQQSQNLAKRGLVTEQLVELPILRQIYDMIDAAGLKGLTTTEVSATIVVKHKQCNLPFVHKLWFYILNRFFLKFP